MGWEGGGTEEEGAEQMEMSGVGRKSLLYSASCNGEATSLTQYRLPLDIWLTSTTRRGRKGKFHPAREGGLP